MADTTEPEIRLPDTDKLVVSSSPHLHQRQDARKIMVAVAISLLPACAAGVHFFGWRALWVVGVTTAACVALEALICLWRGDERAGPRDVSAVVTGMLLGMNLPVGTPWWACVIGAVLAIGLGKQIYGGLGYNLFNPALVGRVGLFIAFPKIMTTWYSPLPGRFWTDITDATTAATPLDLAAQGTVEANYLDYFLGNMGGSIGETSALALLLGGALLIYLRHIRWQIPVAFIGTVAVITWVMQLTSASQAGPLFHVLTGGLMLGAIFMATDMVTSPMSRKGMLAFGVGCGVVTCVIRLWGSYPEGVSFAILFMNALVPLIDRYTANRPFGMAAAHVQEASTA